MKSSNSVSQAASTAKQAVAETSTTSSKTEQAIALQNNASATSVKGGKESVGSSGHILKRSASTVTTKQVVRAPGSIEAPIQAPQKLEKQSQSSSAAQAKPLASKESAKETGPINLLNPEAKPQTPVVPVKKKQQLKEASASQSGIASQSKASSVKEASRASSVERQPNQVTPIKKQTTSSSMKATPKLAGAQVQKSSATKLSGNNAASKKVDKIIDKLIDKWPGLVGASDWNRDEKERQIRENLAKMAGITIGVPLQSMNRDKWAPAPATQNGKQPVLSKGHRARLVNQQQLNLERQYQHQNFATLTCFDANKKIRVGNQYQVQVNSKDYPGGVASEEKKVIADVQNPEEVAFGTKRPSSNLQADSALQSEAAKPQKRARDNDGLHRLVSKGKHGDDTEEMREYLELCDFIMREASSNLNGMLLRGSSQYQEKAMKILTQHNYNYDMAKFSILYPTVLLIPETRNKFLNAIREDDTLLGKIVREAVQDLKGCKQDEVDEVVTELRVALSKRIKPDELTIFERKFKKMQVSFPEDINGMLLDAEEFSKQVRKKINPNMHQDRRLSLIELEELQKIGQAQCLETPELVKLDVQVTNAHDWLEKVQYSQNRDIALRDLDKLVRSGKQLPVKFGEQYETLCQRLNDAISLQKRIQATFKSNKTRKTAKEVDEGRSGTKPSNVELISSTSATAKSNHGMYQEELNETLQRLGFSLKVSFKDLDELSDLIQRVQNWKHHVSAFLDKQSIRQQMRKRLKFKNYLNEAKLLKLGMPLVHRLQRQADYIDWREQVNSFWRKAIHESGGEQLSTDAQLVAEIESAVGSDPDNVSSSENSDEKSSSSKSLSARSEQQKQTIVASTKKITVQGFTFSLLENERGESFAERVSPKKIDMAQMRQLIQDMIEKGFYNTESERLPLSSQESIHANSADAKMEEDKVEIENVDDDATEQKKGDEDVEMLQLKEAISLDQETGNLTVDERQFALCEKPYTVQLLLCKYQESKELAEQMEEIVEDISEIQSAGSISQLLTAQNEANFELFEINDLHALWLKCSNSVIYIPRLADFFRKVVLVAEKEKVVSELDLFSLSDLKTAFAEVYSCCRTGIRTVTFSKLYASVQRAQLWCHHARSLVKDYYKTIDLKHSQLNLIDGQLVGKPFERSNPFKAAKDEKVEEIFQQSHTSAYDKIKHLLTTADQSVRLTNEYIHLTSLSVKIDTAIDEVKSLTSSINDSENEDLGKTLSLLNRLDNLLTIGLPLEPQLQSSAAKLLKLKRWKLRLAKLKQSKQVTLKQIESVLKESKSHAVQEDTECRIAAQKVEQHHTLCKQWLVRYEAIEDFTNLTVVTELLNQAQEGSLGFVLEEFTLLKEDHYESLIQIKNGTEALFGQVAEGSQVMQDTLKGLIELKLEMRDDHPDSKHENNIEPAVAVTQAQPISLGEAKLDLRGNDIDLLQSMDSLVEVWRTISRRALTVAVHPETVIFLTHKTGSDSYELQKCCSTCQAETDKDDDSTVSCSGCLKQTHRSCLQLRQIGNGEEQAQCLTCQLWKMAQGSALSETPQERFPEVAQQVFQWRRQRLSVEQLAVLIEVGETLLPSLHLPELPRLKEENQRVEQLLSRLNSLTTNYTGASDASENEANVTGLINQSETLIVDLNKHLWQAVLQTHQLRQLAETRNPVE